MVVREKEGTTEFIRDVNSGEKFPLETNPRKRVVKNGGGPITAKEIAQYGDPREYGFGCTN